MKNIKALMLGLPIVLASCNNNSKIDFSNSKKGLDSSNTEFETISLPKKVAVNPVYEDLDVPFSSFKVDASKDTVLTFGEKETQIKIPARSFVYKNGKPVEGEVNIDYREIRSVAEIMLSGITMEYDSAGTTYDFQTAGMFDIRGYKNGEPIEIAPDKPLTIEYKSDQTDGDYNFYCLNEENANWEYLSTPKVNLDAIELEDLESNISQSTYISSDEVEKITLEKKPKLDLTAPQEATKDQEIWDLQYDYVKYPIFSHLTGVMWQYVGDSVNNPLNVVQNKTWEPTAIIPVDEKKGIFKVIIKSRKQTLAMLMKPVYKGKHFEFANTQFQKKLAAYKKDLLKFMDDKKKQEQLQLAYQNRPAVMASSAINASSQQAVRSLQVPSFGIYNCDRYGRETDVINLFAKINAPFPGAEFKRASIFLVSKEGTVVVNKNHLNYESTLKFVSSEDNKLIALYPDKRVSVLNNSYFEQLKFMNNREGIAKILESELITAKIESAKDLDKIIKEL
tara:strand:+ start:3148 stop:4668 length:1521 start_codon:yes stop_codon:yes gene_type:complete